MPPYYEGKLSYESEFKLWYSGTTVSYESLTCYAPTRRFPARAESFDFLDAPTHTASKSNPRTKPTHAFTDARKQVSDGEAAAAQRDEADNTLRALANVIAKARHRSATRKAAMCDRGGGSAVREAPSVLSVTARFNQ